MYFETLRRVRFENRWMQESFTRLLEQYEFLSTQIDKQTQLLRELSETAMYQERVEILLSIGLISAEAKQKGRAMADPASPLCQKKARLTLSNPPPAPLIPTVRSPEAGLQLNLNLASNNHQSPCATRKSTSGQWQKGPPASADDKILLLR
jgi:hypothetical protein